MAVKSVNAAYNLADIRSDAGDDDAAQAISFCASMAETRWKALKKLAWACAESNGRKRNSILQIVLSELENQDEPVFELPSRTRAA